jgi:RimJ/RimL family protein N-acetyltransferase
VSGTALEFRQMVPEDLPLLHEWLQRPHVREWYGERESYDEVVAHYLPSIEGREPTDHYLALLDGRAVGMLQTYVVIDHPEYAAVIDVADAGTAGADILIGEVELTGQGLGTEILRRFVAEVVFARQETTACVADPDARNVASLRAFEKAGFQVVREFVDPSDGQVHALVRLDRHRA